MKRITLIIIFCVIGLLMVWIGGCIQKDRPLICYIDDDYDYNTPGWNYDHFNSIQDAIIAVDTPAQIMIFSGVYHETIMISAPGWYQITGENATNTIIQGDQSRNNVITIGENVHINLSGCTIKDSNRNGKITCYDAGLRLLSDNNTITGNIFMNNSCGIYMEYAVENNISDNLFYSNYYGMLLYTGSNNNSIMHNVLKNNQIGCKLKGSLRNILHNNLFGNNTGGVSLCCLSTENLFYENIFKKNSEFHALDWSLNTWNTSTSGNFWDTFYRDDQGAYDMDLNGIIDSAYNISRGYQPLEYPNKDYKPLRMEPVIRNSFLFLSNFR
jgi:parallel beta-helix repeat protein